MRTRAETPVPPLRRTQNAITQSTLCVATCLTDASVEQILMDLQAEF